MKCVAGTVVWFMRTRETGLCRIRFVYALRWSPYYAYAHAYASSSKMTHVYDMYMNGETKRNTEKITIITISVNYKKKKTVNVDRDNADGDNDGDKSDEKQHHRSGSLHTEQFPNTPRRLVGVSYIGICEITKIPSFLRNADFSLTWSFCLCEMWLV